MEITFNLPFVFSPFSTKADNARSLRSLLEMLVQQNLIFLQGHPKTPALYRAGVVYGRTQIWDSIPALYRRGYGDCKSLTAALVAEYRFHKIAAVPVFRWQSRPNGDGNRDFHILVQTDRGFEDPSRRLGMGADEVARYTE
jgi:hypothetical protein